MWVRSALVCALFVLLTSPAEAQEQGDEEGIRRRERAALLAAKLPAAIRERSIGPVVPGLTIGLGALLGAGYVANDFEQPALLASSLTAIAGGTAYFVVPESHRNEALRVSMWAAQGGSYLWLGGLVDPGLDRSLYAVAAGYYTAALLEGLNLGLTRHPGITRLQRGYAMVASPEGRSALSASELAAIERDFLASERPIPHALIGLPLVLGGGLALVPAFESDVAGEERSLAAIFGTVTMLQGFAEMAFPNPVAEYESDLYRASLRLAAGGVVLEGSF